MAALLVLWLTPVTASLSKHARQNPDDPSFTSGDIYPALFFIWNGGGLNNTWDEQTVRERQFWWWWAKDGVIQANHVCPYCICRPPGGVEKFCVGKGLWVPKCSSWTQPMVVK